MPGSEAAAVGKSTMGLRDWGLLLTIGTLWGGSFFFVSVAAPELPAVTLVFARLAIGALALLGAVRLTGRRIPLDRGAGWLFLRIGLFNNAVPFVLFAWAQHHIAGGLASILNATTPLFTVLLAHVMTADERLTAGKLAGVMAGLLGVIVMIGPAAFLESATSVLAQLACLGAAFCYGFGNIFGRRFRALGIPPVIAATGQISASALILLPFVLLADRPWALPAPSWPVIGAMLSLGLFCTAAAYLLYFRLLASAGAVNAALVAFLVPVSGVLLGVLLRGEVLLARQLGGMAFIGLGLGLIDGRPLRWLWAPIRAHR